jgi:cyclophilin family peptidyl-prolyl cis-trans isomerase
MLVQCSEKKMKYSTISLLLLLLLAATTVYSQEMPIVSIQTNFGTIVLELYPNKAPKTVANFIRYAQDGFYEGTIFHRVVRRFVIQGGGYTMDYEKKPPTYPPIPNESQNGLDNLRGTIAMARRTNEVNSATSQFFINVNNNKSLNYSASSYQEGYTVFGQVIKGMSVVDKIQQLRTQSKGALRRYVPRQMVIIEKVTVENIPVTKPNSSPTLTPTETEEEKNFLNETDFSSKTETSATESKNTQTENSSSLTKPEQETSSTAAGNMEKQPAATTDSKPEPSSTAETETETTTSTNPQNVSNTIDEEDSSSEEPDTESAIFSLFSMETPEDTETLEATDTPPNPLSPLASENQENLSIVDRETEGQKKSSTENQKNHTNSTEETVKKTETVTVANIEKQIQQTSEATAQESETLLSPPDSPSPPDKPEALPD